MVENIFAKSVFNKQFTFLLSPSLRKTFIANLAEGQLLEGKVVKVLNNNTYLVNFRGSKVVAESMIPLKTGQGIQVRVVQTYPQVVMNLIREVIPEQKVLSLIRSYLPLQINWAELIEDLSRVLTDREFRLLEMIVDKEMLEKVLLSLSSLSFDENKVGNSENIKQFIEYSGLLYESKLKRSLFRRKGLPEQLMKTVEKDFKGLLLRLSKKLEDVMERLNESEEIVLKSKVGSLLRKVSSSIKRIELHQLVNYLTIRNDQQLVFQIPLILPDGLKTAELYIRNNYKKGRKKQDDFHIVFLLNMKGLGELRIDTHLFKKRIGCKIQVGNVETANFVKGNLSELSQRLESLGYIVDKLECFVSCGDDAKKEAPIQGFPLLEMRLLDVVA